MRRMLLTVAIGLGALLFASPSWAGDAAAGEVIFVTNCATCHGTSGKGDGPVGKALTPTPRDFTTGDFKFDTDEDGTPGTDSDIRNVIANGGGAYGGSPLMAPWPTLSDDDVNNVIVYIRSLKQ
jgi:mono/diheme cytochrome c family protein